MSYRMDDYIDYYYETAMEAERDYDVLKNAEREFYLEN